MKTLVVKLHSLTVIAWKFGHHFLEPQGSGFDRQNLCGFGRKKLNGHCICCVCLNICCKRLSRATAWQTVLACLRQRNIITILHFYLFGSILSPLRFSNHVYSVMHNSSVYIVDYLNFVAYFENTFIHKTLSDIKSNIHQLLSLMKLWYSL